MESHFLRWPWRHGSSRVFTFATLPIASGRAIHPAVRSVSFRNRTAILTYAGKMGPAGSEVCGTSRFA